MEIAQTGLKAFEWNGAFLQKFTSVRNLAPKLWKLEIIAARKPKLRICKLTDDKSKIDGWKVKEIIAARKTQVKNANWQMTNLKLTDEKLRTQIDRWQIQNWRIKGGKIARRPKLKAIVSTSRSEMELSKMHLHIILATCNVLDAMTIFTKQIVDSFDNFDNFW